MRKLTLDLDDLTVEVFETTPDLPDGEGTVLAHASTGNEIQCGCQTWEVRSCDIHNCGGDESAGCPTGTGGDRTWEYRTCATGNQIQCECYG